MESVLLAHLVPLEELGKGRLLGGCSPKEQKGPFTWSPGSAYKSGQRENDGSTGSYNIVCASSSLPPVFSLLTCYFFNTCIQQMLSGCTVAL